MPIGRPIDLTANVATKRISAIATANQTDFTVTGGYRINQLGVYRNGIRLVDGRDYIATDGSTVVLLSAATVDDVIEFQVFDSFNVSDSILSNSSEQTLEGNLTITGTLDVQTGETGNTAYIGISSNGTNIGVAKTLNFIGTGNTFEASGDTIAVKIKGGGGGGLGTAINYTGGTASPFSYIDMRAEVEENLMLDSTKAGVSSSYIVSVIPTISVASGAAVTVGAGKTMIIDVLKIGDL
jgi:hypothetical protein